MMTENPTHFRMSQGDEENRNENRSVENAEAAANAASAPAPEAAATGSPVPVPEQAPAVQSVPFSALPAEPDLVQLVAANPGGLPHEVVTACLADILVEISARHRRGLVHGRLSPSCIVRRPDGRFLLRAETGADEEAFAPAEKRAGRPPTARTDVFSLGLIAGYLLTGRTPGKPSFAAFDGAALPFGWSRWIRRAASPEVAGRFPSADEALSALPGYRTGAKAGRTLVICAVLALVLGGFSWLVLSIVGRISDFRRDAAAQTVSAAGEREPVSAPEASNTALAPSEGSAWTVPGVGIEMLWIRPGRFTMGSPEGEVGHSGTENAHIVTLSSGYWLGRYEVTHAQWKSLMHTEPGEFNRGVDNAPVEQVNWLEAVEFCRRLTEREKAAGRLPEGWEYALPSEAQWEYACRAGASSTIYTGPLVPDQNGRSAALGTIAWYAGNASASAPSGADGQSVPTGPHPVGTLKPNHWGFFDMLGNVREWCSDWYGPLPAEEKTDPAGPAAGSARVFRGGAWSDPVTSCRSASRASAGIHSRNASTGLRVGLVRAVPRAEAASAEASVPAEGVSPIAYNLPESGQRWRLRDLGLDMAWIEPGDFRMGSPDDEAGHDKDEAPVHAVKLTKGFWMGRHEVTQAQWQKVMGTDLAAQQSHAAPDSAAAAAGPGLPMCFVSWEDAVAFCAKLNETEMAAGRLPAGWQYALPTEAQWEYACRAGSEGAYSAGNLDAVAWYDGDADEAAHPVGRKVGNAFGLYDMHGNLFEWVADWYGPYAVADAADPNGPSEGSFRVFRGGSWLGGAALCRSAYRGNAKPDFCANGIGFRIALVPDK